MQATNGRQQTLGQSIEYVSSASHFLVDPAKVEDVRILADGCTAEQPREDQEILISALSSPFWVAFSVLKCILSLLTVFFDFMKYAAFCAHVAVSLLCAQFHSKRHQAPILLGMYIFTSVLTAALWVLSENFKKSAGKISVSKEFLLTCWLPMMATLLSVAIVYSIILLVEHFHFQSTGFKRIETHVYLDGKRHPAWL